MKYGLTHQQLDYLNNQIVLPLKRQGATVYLFGSRARGTQHHFSDLDLLVESEKDLSNVISQITEIVEEGNFPYKVDIVQARSLADSYRSNVNHDKIKL